MADWPCASTSSVVTVPCWWGTREAGHVPGVSSLCRRSIFTPHRLSRCSNSSNLPHPGVLGAALQAAVQYNPIYPWKCSLCAGLTGIWEWKPQEHHLFHNTRDILDAEGSLGMHGWAPTPAGEELGWNWHTPGPWAVSQHEDDQAGPAAPSVITESLPIQALQCLQGVLSLSPQKAWL